MNRIDKPIYTHTIYSIIYIHTRKRIEMRDKKEEYKVGELREKKGGIAEKIEGSERDTPTD